MEGNLSTRSQAVRGATLNLLCTCQQPQLPNAGNEGSSAPEEPPRSSSIFPNLAKIENQVRSAGYGICSMLLVKPELQNILDPMRTKFHRAHHSWSRGCVHNLRMPVISRRAEEQSNSMTMYVTGVVNVQMCTLENGRAAANMLSGLKTDLEYNQVPAIQNKPVICALLGMLHVRYGPRLSIEAYPSHACKPPQRHYVMSACSRVGTCMPA